MMSNVAHLFGSLLIHDLYYIIYFLAITLFTPLIFRGLITYSLSVVVPLLNIAALAHIPPCLCNRVEEDLIPEGYMGKYGPYFPNVLVVRCNVM